MVSNHCASCPPTEAGFVQNVLDATDAHAFAQFMHNETVRALHDCKALVVQGD